MEALSRALAGHPSNPLQFHHHIEARVRRLNGGRLGIGYAITGSTAALRLPTAQAPAPADALWRATCCEFFIGSMDGTAYREFNFSPSGQWAAYDFADYRRRAATGAYCPAPSIELRHRHDGLELDVALDAAALPAGNGLRIGLSVVLEADDGSLGYWALAHPPGRPDFHHRDCFALKIEAAT